MATATGSLHRIALLVSLALPGACKSHPAVSPTPTPGSVAPAPSGSAESNVSIVDASVVVSECPDSKIMNGKMAREAIRKLVDPCAAVPGGSAHFEATLLPDGRVELAAPSETVPTCVIKNKLAHKVQLQHPCKFDVKLDERPGSGPASSAVTH